MKVERLLANSKGLYPYKYRVECGRSLLNFVPFNEWVDEVKFKCCLVPEAIYIRNDEDLAFFMLRWS